MKTTIELNDELVEQAFALTGIKTKKELINFALAELVKSQSPKNLLDLAGKIEFAEGSDIDVAIINRYVIDRDNTDL